MGSVMTDREVWFVTGSQHLYGTAVLDRVAEDAGVIAACLDQTVGAPVRIVPRPVVSTPEGITEMLRDADRDDRCIGVIAWMHTFSPAKMWIAGLTDLRTPLVHLHTQFNRDLPWSSIDMDFMNLHQSAHGDREFAFIQTRLRRSRRTIVGYWEDPVVAAKLGAWCRAALGWHASHQLKIARFGDNMRDVAVTEGDKVEAQARFGFSVNGFGVNDLVGAVEDVPEADSIGLSRRTARTMTSRRPSVGMAHATPIFDRPPASRQASGRSSTPVGSPPSRTRSRISALSTSCRGSRSSG